MKFFILLLSLLLLGVSSTEAADVTIKRDAWGVAHIHGKTHADAFFGMGYAQAEDHSWQLEDTCLRAIGRYAEVAGVAELSSDILNRSFEIVARSKEDFPKLAPEHQLMATAYVDGINRYLASHPETKLRRLTRFEPWHVLAMDRHIILHFVYRAAHVKRPGARKPGEVASASWDFPEPEIAGFSQEIRASIGSNAWAIAGSKTASGAAMLFINPHLPWYGMGQFYESHISSDEGLNFSGAGFLGSPLPTIGHNPDLGWAFTVNDPDIADAWRVTFDDAANRLNYRYNDGFRTAVEWSETLAIKQDDEIVEQKITFRKTHHGPITKKENDTTYLAVQVARLFDMNRVNQAWGMVRARNFHEWKTAFSHCAIPMFNVVYADRAGNIYYAYNGAIPIRDPKFDWTKPVDGSNPRTEWQGFHTLDQLPQVFNPKCGYIQNCNSSPFVTTDNDEDNPNRAAFPADMLEDHNTDMRRAKRSRQILSAAKGVTFDRWQALAFDNTLYWPMTEIPRLKDDFARVREQNPKLATEVEAAFLHLQNWDYIASTSSTQTTLCVAWYEELYGFGYPAETLKPEYRDDRLSWFKALSVAMKSVSRLYGDWKYPWGKAHRHQRIAEQPDVEHAGLLLSGAKSSLPLSGAPGPLGIINTVYSSPGIPLIRPERYAVVGACYMAVVEFGNPVQARSIMPFGTSGNYKSPHFFDQAALYSATQLKPAWFTPAEVAQNGKSTVELKR